MIYIWKLTGDVLELNLKEILQYDELKYIYTRDKMNGHVQAIRDFKYINFITNRNGYCVREGLSIQDARAFAKKNADMPKDYVEDKYMTAAIIKARELNGGVIEGLIDATVSAFRIDAKMMTKVKELLEDLDKKVADVEGIQQIVKLTDVVVDISNKIPTKIEKLLELREMYEKIQSKTINEKRGGGSISNSLDGTGIESHDDSGETERLD